ncbi:MAG: glycosyltransferase family 2 protein [Betaproteobacteria bacterium]|nr:glycosyltransferase family 2 protein [Betaproteobacteria bacterium]
MTVHALVPVFNRLEKTRQILACLREQELDEPLRLIVINDGSTDGTAEYLSTQENIVVLDGDGSLWWGGAMETGLRYVLRNSPGTDWVLMINNDTKFNQNFVQTLVSTARTHSPAVVGSVICDEKNPSSLLSIGGMIDSWRFQVRDKLEANWDLNAKSGPHLVDVLSGRGTLYPLSVFKRVGTMRPRWLPHYLGDYELAVRARRAGYRLLVCANAATLSANDYGSSYRPSSLADKFFNVRSPYYLPATWLFWWSCSSWIERVTLLPRLIYVGLKQRSRH